MTESIGHGPDFWNNFAWILREAEAKGLYQHTDFTAHPVPYCGVSITDQPSYDHTKDEEFSPAAGQTSGLSLGKIFYS
jgi:hypothetical protein